MKYLIKPNFTWAEVTIYFFISTKFICNRFVLPGSKFFLLFHFYSRELLSHPHKKQRHFVCLGSSAYNIDMILRSPRNCQPWSFHWIVLSNKSNFLSLDKIKQSER